jgi:hypothetical protein
MASITRDRRSGLTRRLPFNTRETVAIETWASDATSLMVGMVRLPSCLSETPRSIEQ